MKKSIYIPLIIAGAVFSADLQGAETVKVDHGNSPVSRGLIMKRTSDGSIVRSVLPSSSSSVSMKKSSVIRRENESERIPVKVIVDPSEDGIDIVDWLVMIDADKQAWGCLDLVEGEAVIEVPPGKYTLHAVFGVYSMAFVIFPDMEVSEPVEVHVCRDMADNVLTARPLTRDGSPAILPEEILDGAPQGNFNIKELWVDPEVSYDGICTSWFLFGTPQECQELDSLLTLRTNLADDKLMFCWYFHLTDTEDEQSQFFVAMNGKEALHTDTVSNDPSLYRPFKADMVHTPIFDSHGKEGAETMFTIYYKNHSFASSFGTELLPGKSIWLCNDMDQNLGMYAFVKWRSMEIYDDGFGWGIQAPRAAYKDGKLRFFSTPEQETYGWPEEPSSIEYWPVNEAFSYDSFPGLVFGNSTPICVINKDYIDWVDPAFSYVVPKSYSGNAGDNRIMDLMLAEAEVRSNGKVVFERGDQMGLYPWMEEWSAGPNAAEPLTYIFYNENVNVDDIKGSNVCEVTVYPAEEDDMAPTLQRLMLRDKDGNPSIHFDTPSDGMLTLAGGDFIRHAAWLPNEYGEVPVFGYSYAPAQIEVEYAPMGTDGYRPLAVEEIKDKFFMPGYGAFWEGSLEPVSASGETGWFDLRITLTDTSGNMQRQTLSPAFHIETTLGTDRVSSEYIALTVRNGHIEAADGGEVSVTSLSGITVPNRNLARGIYIARCGEHVSKVLVR